MYSDLFTPISPPRGKDCRLSLYYKDGFPMENESRISLLITKFSYFYTIKIAKLYEISRLISVSILIGNPPSLIQKNYINSPSKKSKTINCLIQCTILNEEIWMKIINSNKQICCCLDLVNQFARSKTRCTTAQCLPYWRSGR